MLLIKNFRLASTSPAINAGNNNKASEISLDLDRKQRIINDVVDLGAYEYETGTANSVLKVNFPYLYYNTNSDNLIIKI